MKSVSPPQRPKIKRKPREDAFARDSWLGLARKALLAGGVEDVKIERLSIAAGVKRSSFYWHFRDRQDLLDTLLDHWQSVNTGPLIRAIEAAKVKGPKGFREVSQLWIDEKEFSPAYDTAVRNWARKAPRVAKIVSEVDAKRIAAFVELMEAYGYQGDDAKARARIIYFHQVGYYALGISESHADRERLMPAYLRALIGPDAS